METIYIYTRTCIILYYDVDSKHSAFVTNQLYILLYILYVRGLCLRRRYGYNRGISIYYHYWSRLQVTRG